MVRAAPTGSRAPALRRWVLFVDERNVPHSSPDSNYGATVKEFLKKVRRRAGSGGS